MASLRDELRLRLGVPLIRATTLPRRWYGDPEHHRAEVDAVFATDGRASASPTTSQRLGRSPPRSSEASSPWSSRDAKGALHGFLNVCRHRGSPVAEGCGTARVLQCPYHAWIYQLDGRLSKARGMADVPGFDVADSGLFPVQVATWSRFLFANPDLEAAPLDLGPLAGAIEPFAVEQMELGVTEHVVRSFNWKLLVENYSENFHTPFVHPQLEGAAWDYVIDVGARSRSPPTASSPGWEHIASTQSDEPFLSGKYFTVFPNLMVSVFPRYFHALIVTPVDARTSRVDYHRCWAAEVGEARRKVDHEAALAVGEQDLEICERVQRSYDGGLDPRGRLSPQHEKGVAHVHQLLLRSWPTQSGNASARTAMAALRPFNAMTEPAGCVAAPQK